MSQPLPPSREPELPADDLEPGSASADTEPGVAGEGDEPVTTFIHPELSALGAGQVVVRDPAAPLDYAPPARSTARLGWMIVGVIVVVLGLALISGTWLLTTPVVQQVPGQPVPPAVTPASQPSDARPSAD